MCPEVEAVAVALEDEAVDVTRVETLERTLLDPRHVFAVAYYVHKFREVGRAWDHGD